MHYHFQIDRIAAILTMKNFWDENKLESCQLCDFVTVVEIRNIWNMWRKNLLWLHGQRLKKYMKEGCKEKFFLIL